MSIVIILAILLCTYRSKIFIKGMNNEYISMNNTKSINGFITMMVFYRNYREYVILQNNITDSLFLIFDAIIGQLIVVSFGSIRVME